MLFLALPVIGYMRQFISGMMWGSAEVEISLTMTGSTVNSVCGSIFGSTFSKHV